MRNILLFSLLLLSATIGLAQPANDDCVGLIDLGVVPICPSGIYTNVDATASDIGSGNIPDCFNGGNVNRDVWFMFTTDNMITDYTVSVTGVTDGMGSTAMSNPQIEIYRGDCAFNSLASLEVCASAADGDNFVTTTVFGLDPNTPYFIRVNDYSSTALPNSGSFEFCITENIPDINICDSPSTNACTGTVYDCGGPDGDYTNNENSVFTICPNEFHECILLDVQDFNIEFNFDFLNVYAGDNINAPLAASLTGVSNGQPYQIQVSSSCVTLQFTSDGTAAQPGFEIDWQCVSFPCDGSSEDNPTVITGIPFDDALSTCDGAATIGESPCPNDDFLVGPDYVFTYESLGDICASITISNAAPGTGVLVLDGPPTDPASNCVATGEGGTIASANFEDPGTYYIIVANAAGCTDFDISIEEADCSLSPALVDALCNPLNGCQEFDPDGNPLPTQFVLGESFQDIDIVNGVNGGCWLGVGQGNFYWFTIEAQADGPFGFSLQGVNFDSDIDINVWGPFTPEQSCDMPNEVITFIENNEPIRSTWAPGFAGEATGLADIHPITGIPVTDPFDCDPIPGAGGDDFCSTIPAQEGEVYVILFNDFGGALLDGVIEVDWAASAPEVIESVPVEVVGIDTAICVGESVQLQVVAGLNNADISWIDPNGSLSCTDCTNPIATPLATTIYELVVVGICSIDTVPVKVSVFDVDAGPDIVVCLGENVQFNAGSEYSNATYDWAGPNIGEFSCTDCPDPFLTTSTSGTFTYTVTLNGPSCVVTDEITLEVLTDPAPDFGVLTDTLLHCAGTATDLGLPSNDPAFTYSWTSVPPGFTSSDPNPSFSPLEDATYYVEVTSTFCPVSSTDSITILVDPIPANLDIVPSDTSVCQGSIVILQTQTYEQSEFPDIEFQWTPNSGLQSPDSLLNLVIQANQSLTYYRTTVNGICTQIDSAVVDVIMTSEIEIVPPDTSLCPGESVQLLATNPDITEFTWEDDSTLSCLECPNPTASPNGTTTYTVSGEVQGCPVEASATVTVIPNSTAALIPDATICPGDMVTLNTLVDNTPGTVYTWTSNPTDPNLDDDVAQPSVGPAVTTTYSLTVDNGVCEPFQGEVTVFVVNDPILSVSEDVILCQGDETILTATSTEEGGNFTWTPGGNGASVPVSPDATTTYTVVYDYGCGVLTDMVNVDVIPGTSVEITIDPDTSASVPEGTIINLTAELGSPIAGATYSWSTGQSTPTISTPANDLPSSSYSVTVTTPEGCEYTADFIIFVDPIQLVFPNAFTPDNDGINDLFRPSISGNLETVYFKVFNRWGQLVYEYTDGSEGWDGTKREDGKAQPSDVYIYHALYRRPSGEEIPKSGDVTLVR